MSESAASGSAAAYHVDAPLVAPSSTTGLLEVFRRRYLLRLLVRREVSARYSGSLLGLFWSYINPLSQFFIYYFVMGVLIGLHKDVPNFAIHMFAGIMVVHFFTETLNAGTRSIVRNRAVVQKMAVPREMFPVSSMLVSAYHVIPQLAIMLVFCLVRGWRPDAVGMVAALLGLTLIMVLGTAMALIFSVSNVFLRDTGNVVHVLTNFVRFGVPMIYPFSIVAQRFHGHVQLYLANPLADGVLLLQRAFWVGIPDQRTLSPQVPAHLSRAEIISLHMPDHLLLRGVIALAASCVLLLIAQLIFSRFDNKIPERL